MQSQEVQHTTHKQVPYPLKNTKQLKLYFMIVVLLSSIYGLKPTASATPFDDYYNGTQKHAPMIEPYQGLSKRSKSAFDELDNAMADEFNEETQADFKQVKAVKSSPAKSRAVKQEKGKETNTPPPPSKTTPVPRQSTPSQPTQELANTHKKVPQPQSSQYEEEVLILVNQERARGGRCGSRTFAPTHPLSAQPLLAKAAKTHALDMAKKSYFSHSSLNGDSPTDRIKATGYRGQAWGENIAAGQRSPKEVVQAWMDSPGHCANILNSIYKELGVSFIFDAQSDFKTYWVQAFGKAR
jgi:uncharacterized protein YkwD